MKLVVNNLYTIHPEGFGGGEVEFVFYKDGKAILSERLRGKVTSSLYKRDIGSFDYSEIIVNKDENVFLDYVVE